MRIAGLVVGLMVCTGCAGAVSWDREVDENGFSITPELTLAPGISGNIPFTLLVEGSYAGTYDFSASSNEAVFVPTLDVTTAEVEADVPFEVLLTVDVSDTATSTDSGFISVDATRSNGDGAGTGVYIYVVD